jgi:hypothetical protein
MSALATLIGTTGLFFKRSQLLARGYTDGHLRRELASGTLIRVRKGWYSLPNAPAPAVEAFRVGGRLAGLSALASYGIWTPETPLLHVTVPRHARALRRPRDMRARFGAADQRRYRVSWTDEVSHRCNPFVWRTTVIAALIHVLQQHDRVTAIVCLDAALNSGAHGRPGISPADLDAIFDAAPARVQAWRSEVDGRAEAGGETEFRLKTLAAGIPFVPQPVVPGVGRLDGQIGPHTFVEIDGGQWHDTPEAFETDRARDLLIAAKHGRVLRFSYLLLRTRWDDCERAMRAALDLDRPQSNSTDFPAFFERMTPLPPRKETKVRRIGSVPERGRARGPEARGRGDHRWRGHDG